MINPSKLNHTYDTSKEIAYWSGEAMSNASRFVDLLTRDQDKLPPTKEDFSIRDKFFKFKMSFSEKKKGLLDYAVDIVSHYATLNNSQYLASVSYQNSMTQRRFWKKILNQRVLNEADQKRKDLINSAIWKHRYFPLMFICSFSFAFIAIMKKTRRSFRAQWIILLMAAVYTQVYIQYKTSSEIFYQIKQFSEPQLEEERIDIINRSIILDGKLELKSQPNTFSQQLMSQVAQEQDEQIKQELIKTSGYAIIDTATFLF